MKYDGNKTITFYFKMNHKSKEIYYCKISNKAALRQCIPICEELKKRPLSKFNKALDSFKVYYYSKYNIYKEYEVIDKYLCCKVIYDNYYVYGNYAGKALFFEFFNSKTIYPDSTVLVKDEMR